MDQPPPATPQPPTPNPQPPSAEADLRRRLTEAEERYEQSQDALRDSRELFEFAPDAYVVTDLGGLIRECNQAFTRLFGRPKAFLHGKPLPFFFSREDRPEFYDRLVQLRRLEGACQEWEACLESRPGVQAFVALTATGCEDTEGRASGFRWLIRDVGPRKAAEDALRAEKAFADGLIEAAQAVVLLADAGGRLLRTNVYLETMTGYPRDQLMGAAWLDRLLAPPDRAEALTLFDQAGRAGVKGHATFPLRTRQGGARVLAWAAQPLRDVRGLPTGVLAVGHDITELQEAQERALRAGRLAVIGQVMTGLAHESRNILQRALGSLERLAWRLQDRPEALELVRRAQQAQEDLVRLFEDVRGYAAPIRIDFAPCDLSSVWREAWAGLVARAEDRDARLEEDAAADPVCEADRFRMGQVFRNLMENSLAACPDPVRVAVSCRDGRLDSRPALRLAVRDNGPGFTPEARRRLFEPFVTTKTKGTGLGLAICRRIVEGHGGRITAGDAGGPGAEIIFTLPRKA